MDIPDEDLPGSYPATAFVGWYNGQPDYHHLHFNLSNTTSAVVIGNGNVAMDVTRILARSPSELAHTDITSYALATLQQSTVEEIIICGRRGPAQAAFTNPEIRELTELQGVDLIVQPEDLTLDAITQQFLTAHASEPTHQRNLEILKRQLTKGEGTQPRKIRMHFFTSPVAILGRDRVEGIRLEHNVLIIDAQGNFIAQGTGRYEELPCQVVFRSIGYKGIPLPNVPFDKRKGVIPNRDGRVIDLATNSPIPRLYVAGWIKRGPSGVIGTNKPDAAATVVSMTIDMEEHRFLPIWADPDSIPALLTRKDIRYVTFADWQCIDNVEVANGQPVGKPREKLTTITSMLSAVRENA
jgi:ferredoxin/flavodoxin---NADP+ reductase